MSLLNNRRNSMVPSRPNLSLGSEELPWASMHTSNLFVSGSINSRKFVGDGSGLTNVPFPNLSSVTQNIVPNSNLIQDLGSVVNRFRNAYCSNLYADNATIGNVHGNGNGITFDGLYSSIVPAFNQTSTIGSSAMRFDGVYTNKVDAKIVTATQFIGDGSLLTGIRPNTSLALTNIQTSLLTLCNLTYDIGSPNMRFNNAYLGNLSARGVVQGARLLITNQSMSIFAGSNVVNGAGVEFAPNLPDNISGKFGDQIDAVLNNLVVGVLYAKEFIGDGSLINNIYSLAPMQSNIIPHKASVIDIGEHKMPFKNIYGTTLYLTNDINAEGNLNVSLDVNIKNNTNIGGNVQVDKSLIVNNTITAKEFVGDGRYIDNITHFGLINNIVLPYLPSVIDIGSKDLCFKSLHADMVRAPILLLAGQAGIGTETPRYALDVIGDIHYTGKIMNNGSPASTTKTGYLLTNEIKFFGIIPISYASQNIDYFIDVNMSTGLFTARQSGVYNITPYLWKTSRATNDQYVSWVVSHMLVNNSASAEHRLTGTDSKTLVLAAGDSFTVSIISNGGFLSLFKGSTIVVTQLATMDNFDLNPI